MKQLLKCIFLFFIGGFIYILIELIGRGYSHWTMFLLGGMCFILVGYLNECYTWSMSVISQMFISSIFITFLELVIGMVVNIWLKWNVWDYSKLPYNFIGQICMLYTHVWFLLSFLGILLDDYLRFWFFGEEKPHYKLF